MSNSLQQLNISYNSEQDRLLLRARGNDDSEYRVWLTRRYCSLLLEVLGKQIDQYGGLQQVSSDKQTLTQMKQGAFEHEYKVPVSNTYPLGEDGILGFGINTDKMTADGTFPLHLVPQGGAGLSLNLNKSMLYLLLNILEQGIVQANWNLQTPTTNREAVH